MDIVFHGLPHKKGRIAIQPEAEHHTLFNNSGKTKLALP
tara:strand:- start:179 stop:295 length:117 start_codon:yes stop_codon:yes gene_type:complete